MTSPKAVSAFQAQYPSVLMTSSEPGRIRQLVNRIVHFVHRKIGLFVLQSQGNPYLFTPSEKLKGHQKLEEIGGKLIEFKTADGFLLKGMHFLGKDCNKNSPTLILFNGSAVRYELYGSQKFSPIRLFAISNWLKLGVNVVVFNYRGVDHPGTATKTGLTLDGDAIYQYVREELKVPENKIIFHAHSLGAAIASEVAKLHPIVNFCCDRSFYLLSELVKLLFKNRIFGGSVLGFLFSKIIIMTGWEYNVFENWNKIKGHKWVITHPHDPTIPKGVRLVEKLISESITSKIEMKSRKFKTKKGLDVNENVSLINRATQSQIIAAGNSAHMRKLQGIEEKALYEKEIKIIFIQ